MLEEKVQVYEKKERISRVTPAKYKEENHSYPKIHSLNLCDVQQKLEKTFYNHFKSHKQFVLLRPIKKKQTTYICGAV